MAMNYSGDEGYFDAVMRDRILQNARTLTSSPVPGISAEVQKTIQNKQKFESSKPLLGGVDAKTLIQALGNSGANTGNTVAGGYIGDYYVAPSGAGGYQIMKRGEGLGTSKTPANYYDASGNFIGSSYVDSSKGAIAKAISAAVPILATAFIGGGIAGGFGYGPFAGGGEGAMAGAGSSGVGGYMGDPTAWGYGVAEGAGGGASLGGAAGAGAAGTAAMGAGGGGSSLGSLGSLLKSGASTLFGGGGGGEGGSSWLGPLATLAGGLMGSQGQEASTSSTRSMDPRMEALFYGGLAPGAMGLLEGQMGPASKAGNQMLQFGSGLLGQKAPNTATNPYATGILDDMQRRHSDVIGQSLAGIRGNAVGVGGLGGSRQGVAEAQAISQGADNFAGQGFNFMGGLYEGDQNRLRQDWTLGAGLMNQGLNTPYIPLQNTANLFSPFTGFGTTTQTQQQGGGAMGAVGGALGAAQLGKNMGWW